jgi:hypothetical protein
MADTKNQKRATDGKFAPNPQPKPLRSLRGIPAPRQTEGTDWARSIAYAPRPCPVDTDEARATWEVISPIGAALENADRRYGFFTEEDVHPSIRHGFEVLTGDENTVIEITGGHGNNITATLYNLTDDSSSILYTGKSTAAAADAVIAHVPNPTL